MGRIISMPEGSKNFFTVTKDNKENPFGTAVSLSRQRAETIRNYLLTNGIATNRMEVKGWGGKKPLFPEDSPLAFKNKRVEVEVLEN
jgi:outer membrane protein OmpA-like peptidoglycan-associated protein